MGSHFVYNHVIYIHKIGHNVGKLALYYNLPPFTYSV